MGSAAGRRSPEDVTVFGSSGIALQDLAVATSLPEAHHGTTRDETM
jgi:ornithine cyclodeaminase/alanine dehydrogenase-like protein (mu-crystallin family)